MRIDWPTMFAIFLALVLFEIVNQTIILPRFPTHKLASRPLLDSAAEQESPSVDAWVRKLYPDARTLGG